MEIKVKFYLNDGQLIEATYDGKLQDIIAEAIENAEKQGGVNFIYGIKYWSEDILDTESREVFKVVF